MHWSDTMGRMIGLLQIDPTVGDLAGNAQRLEHLSHLAAQNGASVGVTTELAISGYPPRDLLLQDEFIRLAQQTASSLKVPIPVLVGSPIEAQSSRQLPGNGVVRAGSNDVLSSNANSQVVARKQLLPTYDVFDEARYFHPDNRSGIARTIAQLDLGVTVCEDAWQAAGLTPSAYSADPIEHLAEWGRQGVQLDATVNLSASPYHADKLSSRIHVCRTAAQVLGHPFLLANQVGGNDDLLFDGNSLVAWPDGRVVVAPAWQEGVLVVDIDDASNCTWVASESPDALCIGSDQIRHLSSEEKGHEYDKELLEDLTDAVVTGLSDYCRKSGISSIVLGLSGGIDSAVAACVAAAAVGPENVLGLAMPSRHSSQHSIDDARFTAETLGISFDTIPIDSFHTSVEESIGDVLTNGHPVASENLQARLRGLLVMAHANAQGRMAIATGNKSELAQGYCTLYGDMAGGYAPLGDLYKMQVYGIADIFNSRAEHNGRVAPVNQSTRTKPPSAELAPDQKDEDSLPPYHVLDEILHSHIEEGLDAQAIAEKGFEHGTVVEVLTRLERSEHKRWQMSPAPRVSSRAFGQGWRRPLASRHDWRR
ncbi:MAG: NAD+ synthase [Candidatus Poseidoniaceae archaeon]|jgi:NAD+ synthase (glutamine-hydrolysing)|tara:strand:- start:2206 stop:3987 length:1782 start_codon:yes stop_codon:yes gene_type:complete